MRNTTSTRTNARNHSARTGLVEPETVVINGAEVLAGTDAGEVAEALAEIAAEEAHTATSTPAKKARKATVKAVKEAPAPTTTRKLTSRELAMQALEAFNEKAIANQTRTRPLVFANHVLGNLADSGKATFAVLDGDTKLRMDVHTVAGGGAEVVEVYPVPVKAKAEPVAEEAAAE